MVSNIRNVALKIRAGSHQARELSKHGLPLVWRYLTIERNIPREKYDPVWGWRVGRGEHLPGWKGGGRHCRLVTCSVLGTEDGNKQAGRPLTSGVLHSVWTGGISHQTWEECGETDEK